MSQRSQIYSRGDRWAVRFMGMRLFRWIRDVWRAWFGHTDGTQRKGGTMSTWLELRVLVCVVGEDDRDKAALELIRRFREAIDDNWLVNDLEVKKIGALYQ
jgi:hypothetical protein